MEIILKIISDAFIYIIPVFLLLYLVSIINLPITNYVFSNTKDSGFQISKVLGIILISYIYFTLVSIDSLINIGIFKLNSFISILSSVAINVFLNFIVIKKLKDINLYQFYKNLFYSNKDFLQPLKKLFNDEKIFVFLIVFFYFLNAFEREITYESEQVLHYMIIEKLRLSENLPIEDPEFAGEYFNYYYFGQFIGYTIISFLPYSFEFSYIVLLILIPSLVGTLFLQLVRDISDFYFPEKIYNFAKNISLVFSFIIFYLFTNFLFTIELIQGIIKNSLPFELSEIWGTLTRPIKFTITENFSYSITQGVLHANFVGLLLSLIVIRILFQIYTEKTEFKILNKYFILLGFFLGLMLKTNAADFLIYLVLMIVIILLNHYKFFITNKKEFIKSIILFMYIPLITILLWKWNIFPPGGMIDLVRKTSDIGSLFLFWGSYIIVLGIIYIALKRVRFSTPKYFFPKILVLYSVLILMSLEIFYLRDIFYTTDYFRANTYWKFSNQVLLFITISIGVLMVPFWTHSKKIFKLLIFLVCTLYITYIPYELFFSVTKKTFTGISNVHNNSTHFKKNPDEKEFFEFIGNSTFRDKVFIEYTNIGYTPGHYSVMLRGYNTFLGYHSHEFSWRANAPIIYKRTDIVNEIFLGISLEKSKELLKENNIDYIYVTKFSRDSIKAGELQNHNNLFYFQPISLQEDKLLKLGKIVFQKGDFMLIEVSK